MTAVLLIVGMVIVAVLIAIGLDNVVKSHKGVPDGTVEIIGAELTDEEIANIEESIRREYVRRPQ